MRPIEAWMQQKQHWTASIGNNICLAKIPFEISVNVCRVINWLIFFLNPIFSNIIYEGLNIKTEQNDLVKHFLLCENKFNCWHFVEVSNNLVCVRWLQCYNYLARSKLFSQTFITLGEQRVGTTKLPNSLSLHIQPLSHTEQVAVLNWSMFIHALLVFKVKGFQTTDDKITIRLLLENNDMICQPVYGLGLFCNHHLCTLKVDKLLSPSNPNLECLFSCDILRLF